MLTTSLSLQPASVGMSSEKQPHHVTLLRTVIGHYVVSIHHEQGMIGL